ncbi:MAG: acetoin utilization protein AcuC [Phycisphaerae bacterium]|nr:acetoin utilization protein AcuC [Phycisphaerae bacterium]
MATKKAVFIHSSALEKFSYPEHCPFDTDRAGRVRKVLNSMGLLLGDGRSEVAPVVAKRETLRKFHPTHYLHALRNAARGRWNVEMLNMGIGTVDCPVFAGMHDYPVLAAGGTLTAADILLSGSAAVAFNPSGGFHHAGPEHAAGFCYINDVALACIVFAEKGKKVLYLDVDVHHGDGVANAFYDRSDVMTVSFHQNPETLFPGTGFAGEIGTGPGEGYCLNLPMPVDTYDEAYLKAFEAILPPLAGAFNPDVFVFQCGADALAGDPLAHLQLTNNVYAEIISHLLTFDKPILMTGGGGYNVENTVRAWSLAWSVLCGADCDHEASAAMGGVMLESTDWQGGLRDRALAVTAEQRQSVEPALSATIEAVQAKIFPIHGL